jgi:hypothetical protein
VKRPDRVTWAWLATGTLLAVAGLLVASRGARIRSSPSAGAPIERRLAARRMEGPAGAPGKVVVARDGVVWLVERVRGRAVLARLRGRHLEPHSLPVAPIADLTAGGPRDDYLALAAGDCVGWVSPAGRLVGRRATGDAIDVAFDHVGRLWLSDRRHAALGVVAGPRDRPAEVRLPPDPGTALGTLARAGSGRLWFRAGPRRVGLVEPVTRTFRLLTVPADAPSLGPDRLTGGPGDGAWLTGGDAVWRVAADGAVRRMARGLVPAPGAIVAGPDGNVWVAAGRGPLLGRIAPDGTPARFRLDLPADTRIEDVNSDRRRGALWVATSRPRALLEVPLGDLRPQFTTR